MRSGPFGARSAILVPALFVTSAAAQGPITAQLVANDAVMAWHTHVATNTVVASQSHPAGPLTSASVQAGPQTMYSCSLAPLGAGVRFDARTNAPGPSSQGILAQTHADLLLTLSAAAGTVASLELVLDHGGDMAASDGFIVQVGSIGTVDSSGAACGCATIRHHRLWTWDFANGALPIRIRTDQVGIGGAQGYSLTLTVAPWLANARPASRGSGGESFVANSWRTDGETTNYQLAVLPSTQPQQLAVVRAFGLGAFDVLVLALQPGTTSVPLPSSYGPGTIDLLTNGVAFPSGAVTASIAVITPAVPRAWETAVPLLPPGLTFYVQHVSATASAPFWAGATNVIRFDS